MKQEVYHELFESRVEELEDYREMPMFMAETCAGASPDMGLAPGGLMQQEIYEDEYGLDAWDLEQGFRCFIHLANSEQYLAITGHPPPHKAVNAKDYSEAGLPWFDCYSDGKALAGSDILGKLTSVAAKTIEKGKGILPGNEAVQPKIKKIINKSNLVREGDFLDIKDFEVLHHHCPKSYQNRPKYLAEVLRKTHNIGVSPI